MTEIKDPYAARWDAETLARAEAIKMDKTRYANAVKEAKKMTKERINEVTGMAKVARAESKMPKMAYGRDNKATIRRLCNG